MNDSTKFSNFQKNAYPSSENTQIGIKPNQGEDDLKNTMPLSRKYSAGTDRRCT